MRETIVEGEGAGSGCIAGLVQGIVVFAWVSPGSVSRKEGRCLSLSVGGRVGGEEGGGDRYRYVRSLGARC